MKTTTSIPGMLVGPLIGTLVAALLAACQHPGQEAARHAARPEPGAQQGQGDQLARQNQQGGPATALGIPGAAAAQAAGEANVQTGQQLASAGSPSGVTACVTCHGAQGEGNAAGGFPRIAGQSRAYLARQLGAYANDARVNPIMQPIAKAMNAQQIRDVSAYYASLEGRTGASAAGAAAPGMERGRMLSEIGDTRLRVQACANCHGPGGMGEQPAYPYLAGQHANYLTAAMGAWKSGARKTDDSGQMPHIAQALADADVAALSSYYSAQPAPPAPSAGLVNIPAGSSQRPAVEAAAGAPGPRTAGGSTVRGTGTEQGAPTTGGSQGPGGGGGTQGTQPQQETPPPVKR